MIPGDDITRDGFLDVLDIIKFKAMMEVIDVRNECIPEGSGPS
jgi:hypothetical protein